MGLRRGNSQRQTTLRAISLFIILGTIPFYLLGIGIWLFSPQTPGANSGPTFTPLNNDSQTDDDDDAFATFTPINADDEETVIPTFTPLGGATFTYYTPDLGNILTSTPVPTRYLSPTVPPTSAATNTPPAVNTPVVAPTDVIVPTQPPLIPPTDTPSV